MKHKDIIEPAQMRFHVHCQVSGGVGYLSASDLTTYLLRQQVNMSLSTQAKQLLDSIIKEVQGTAEHALIRAGTPEGQGRRIAAQKTERPAFDIDQC